MNRFAKRPLTAALALALAASGQQLRAADVEIRTPPGGNFAVRDSTGGLLGLLVNGADGQVTIPFLTTASGPAEPRVLPTRHRTARPMRDRCDWRDRSHRRHRRHGGDGRNGGHRRRLHRCLRRHWCDRSSGCDRRCRNTGCDRRDRGNGISGRHRYCRRPGAIGSTGATGSIGAPGLPGSTGAAGAPGSSGATGVTGATGAAGQTVLNGIGAPASGLGVDGDFYIDTATDNLYGPKAGGVWGPPVSLVGAPGATGSAGVNRGHGRCRCDRDRTTGQRVRRAPRVRTGTAGTTGVAGSTGATGATGIAGTTGSTGSTGIAGATGATVPRERRVRPASRGPPAATGTAGSAGVAGTTGATGATGLDGNSVLNGAGPPSDALGDDGDFYLDTATNSLYGPKAGGVWPAARLGSSGAPGIAGRPAHQEPRVSQAPPVRPAQASQRARPAHQEPRRIAGTTGATGAGVTGATGAPGTAGIAGNTGATGAGVTGATGATGTAGIAGSTVRRRDRRGSHRRHRGNGTVRWRSEGNPGMGR